ncbi:MAG: RNA polymerase sigma factor [Bacteroidales bacterium]|nr:RNA polymerase sigma factor [Bacteroidales bacterium]
MRLFIGDKEENLTKRLQDGDKAALRDFYNLYGSYLSSICSRYISDNDDVQDVFQDILLSIISHIKDFSYRGAGSLQAWSSRIAVNQSLKFLKTKKRQDIVQLDRDIPLEDEVDDPDITDIPPEVFHQMIRELPTGYRTILNLYVFENKSHKEIAEILGIKINSSCSQFCRAKNLLTKKIREYNQKKQPR